MKQNGISPSLAIELPKGMEISGSIWPEYFKILTPEALSFIFSLHKKFNATRKELLLEREAVQARIDGGQLPDFLPETQSIRLGDWKCAPLPSDLQDRRVEITGPVDRKMVINALNSGAKVFMADFEDSNAPTWTNCMDGQINLRDAINQTITFEDERRGKFYKLKDKVATLMVRPRGWHLVEKHIHIDGEPMSASLFDFGLYFFHNAQMLIARGSGPYFYLPKLESHLEARLWNDVFVYAQSCLGLPLGTIKATVLVETILASFSLHEILYELRDHSAGLNCGRWDYIFSYIKRFRNLPTFLVPNRAQVGMTAPFMKAYSELVIQACHKRGVHAMGGMAAQIPIKNNHEANEAAMAKVRADKEREAKSGHDGTWVAHPGLIQTAMEIFDAFMPTANQIHIPRDDVKASAADLLAVPSGTLTEEGLQLNIDVGIQYMAAWLRGNGCVPIYNLMEDAATAEISRSQVWQWLHNPNAILEDGRQVTPELYHSLVPGQLDKIKEMAGEEGFASGKYEQAAEMFSEMVLSDDFEEFLTLKAYPYI